MTALNAREARGGGVSIGDVLAQLRPEFPDITISKIRFLETEGLVAPERTPSGYRKFTPTDISRLHYVLAQQRDNYLPLRVIKDQLDAIDRGLVPPGAGGMPQVPHRTITDNAPDCRPFPGGPPRRCACHQGRTAQHRGPDVRTSCTSWNSSDS